MGDEPTRRRSAFEQDLREFFWKLVLTGIVAVILKVTTGFDSWTGCLIVAGLAVFILAACIRGSGRHAD